MNQKEVKVLVVGPKASGKQSVAQNLTGRSLALAPTAKSVVPLAKFLQKDGTSVKLQVWSFSGIETEETQKLFFPHYLVNPSHPVSAVLVVMDHAHLTRPAIIRPDNTVISPAGIEILSDFLNEIKNKAPHLPVRIVVNKIDRIYELDVEDNPQEGRASNLQRRGIEQQCTQLIASLKNLPPGFNFATDVVYYSAREENAAMYPQAPQNPGKDPTVPKPLIENPILKSLELILFGKRAAPAAALTNPNQNTFQRPLRRSKYLISKQAWDEAFKVAGKVLLFLFLFLLFTAVFVAIGALIGAAVGVWSGPGAFFTAMGGAFLGAVTAWTLSILIVAPILGLAVPATIFGIWHRKQPDSPPEVGVGSSPTQTLTNPTSPHADPAREPTPQSQPAVNSTSAVTTGDDVSNSEEELQVLGNPSSPSTGGAATGSPALLPEQHTAPVFTPPPSSSSLQATPEDKKGSEHTSSHSSSNSSSSSTS